MSKAGLYNSEHHRSPTESSDEWFDRELAELKADLARLEASLAPQPSPAVEPPTYPKAHGKPQAEQTTTVHPSPSAAAPAPAPAPPPPEPPAAPVQPPAASPPPTLPTGTDLADPKNFGMMPPTEDLDDGSASPEEYRQRLARHLAFATKVLHTSRVPAAVWREWRAFEKALHERLRALAGNRTS